MAKIALAIAALVMAACSTTVARSASPITPSPVTPPTTASPAQGFSNPKEAAVDGATKQTGATYLDGNVDPLVACPSGVKKCLAIQSEVDGTHAAYFRAQMGSARSGGACFIYTIQDGAGWHFLDVVCAGPESGVSWPDVGEFDYVFVTPGSCANVRATPGLSGKVIACLPADATVTIDGGPDYVTETPPNSSHVWWHIQGKGWMAHEALVPS